MNLPKQQVVFSIEGVYVNILFFFTKITVAERSIV